MSVDRSGGGLTYNQAFVTGHFFRQDLQDAILLTLLILSKFPWPYYLLPFVIIKSLRSVSRFEEIPKCLL